jgi:hypothetical protein
VLLCRQLLHPIQALATLWGGCCAQADAAQPAPLLYQVLAAAGVTLSGAAGARPSGQVVVALPAPPPAPHSGTDPAEGGEEEAAGVTASLKPFSSMLQFLLEPLLLAGGGAGGGERGHYPSGGRGHGQHQHQRGEEAAALLPTLLKVLRAVKSTQVAQVRV